MTLVKDEYGLESAIPYTERELIQRAIQGGRSLQKREPRWVTVKRVFGTGSTVSHAVCTKYGFDPDQMVGHPPPLSKEDYEENLLAHGIVK